MANPTYDLYVKDCIALARSMTIKSVEDANAMNQTLMDYGITVDLDAPITWKYYVNLNGDYHPADVPMYVRSADTQETILFSKDVLTKHPNTRQLYKVGTPEYRRLVQSYPDQRLLIRGILRPVPFEQAYNAADFTILDYDPSYIEPQEVSLIATLQQDINRFIDRWYLSDYRFTESMYYTGMLAVLAANMPHFILNHRVWCCKTNEAHTYHIWEYLGSRGYLDRHRRSVNLTQALWLYRNINWVYRNQGKTLTFNALKENLFTNVGIRLFAYDLIQQQINIDEAGKPLIDIERINLNFVNNTSGLLPTSISELTTKLKEAVGVDSTWLEQDIQYATETTEAGSHTRYQTKVVEALVEFPKPVSEVSTIAIQMRHWLHYAASGSYNTYIYVTESKTGTTIRLTPLEAYVVNMYLFSLWMERPLDAVPIFRANRVVKKVLPTADELMKLVTKQGVSREFAEWTLEQIPQLGAMNSVALFSEHITALVQGLRNIKRQGDYQDSRRLKNDMELFYLALMEDVEYDTGLILQDVLDETGVDFTVLRPQEALELSYRIIQAATGISLGSEGSAGAMQRAMISIMRQLSSYNVQYVTNFDDMAPIAAKRPTIRIGEMDKQIDRSTENLDIGLRYSEAGRISQRIPMSLTSLNTKVTVQPTNQRRIVPPTSLAYVPNAPSKTVTFELPKLQITVTKEIL